MSRLSTDARNDGMTECEDRARILKQNSQFFLSSFFLSFSDISILNHSGFSTDGFGKATWVRRITTRRTPAKRRKSPSIPRWLINTGFNFVRLKDDKLSNVARIPTKIAKNAHVQAPKNGTSSASNQKRRPLFHANIPPKWWNGQLFHAFSTFG